MRRRASFLPCKRLIKNRAKHREKEKMVQPSADTTGMSRPYSTFFLNLTSRQWPSHDVSLPVVSFLLYGFGTHGNEAGNPNIKRAPTLTGTTVLQTFVRTTQWKPFPAESYKDGTLLQLSRSKVSRDSYSPEALQYYSPKQYKIKREMCLKENAHYKPNSFAVLVLHVAFSGSFSYTLPRNLPLPKACICRKPQYQKAFQAHLCELPAFHISHLSGMYRHLGRGVFAKPRDHHQQPFRAFFF